MGDQKAEKCNTPNATKDDDSLPSDSRCSWRRGLSPLELRALSATVLLLGLIVLLISVNTDNWLSDGRLAVGLWGACMQPGCTADVEGLASGIETIKATRGILVTAAFCAGISVFIISVSFYRNRFFSLSLACVSAIASLVASLFVMIAMSVYTNEILEEKMEPDVEAEWSFDAGWVSFPLLFLAGLLTVMLSFIES